jgi:antitoxin component HigA of HigAB toxin-antitoxin module
MTRNTQDFSDKPWLERQLEDPEFQRALATERPSFDFINALDEAMQASGITKAELAKRLGRSRAFVTQAMRRDHNLTFKTAADLAWACGLSLNIGLVPFQHKRPSTQAASS